MTGSVSVNIVFSGFRGSSADRMAIERTILEVLSSTQYTGWQVRIEEFLSAPVYLIEITEPFSLSQMIWKDEDLRLSLTHCLGGLLR